MTSWCNCLLDLLSEKYKNVRQIFAFITPVLRSGDIFSQLRPNNLRIFESVGKLFLTQRWKPAYHKKKNKTKIKLETLGYCLNVRIFEITCVFIHANVDACSSIVWTKYLRSWHCHAAKGSNHLSIITPPSLGNIFFDIRNVITRPFSNWCQNNEKCSSSFG